MNEYVEIDYSIRFIGISEQAVKCIVTFLGAENITINPYYKDKTTFSVIHDLHKDVSSELMKELSSKIDEGEKDIFVSIFIMSDSEIFEIPDYVQRVINSTGLKTTISFTVSFE